MMKSLLYPYVCWLIKYENIKKKKRKKLVIDRWCPVFIKDVPQSNSPKSFLQTKWMFVHVLCSRHILKHHKINGTIFFYLKNKVNSSFCFWPDHGHEDHVQCLRSIISSPTFPGRLSLSLFVVLISLPLKSSLKPSLHTYG